MYLCANICVKRNKNFLCVCHVDTIVWSFYFLESSTYETKMCEISSLCKNSITASKASMQNSVDDVLTVAELWAGPRFAAQRTYPCRVARDL